MTNLKSNLLRLSFLFFIFGCQSSQVFELKTFPAKKTSHSNDLHTILVNSNRVKQKCLFYNAEAENNWRHQYLMYILTDKNEVLEIMHPTNQDKESCFAQMHKIEKILKEDSKVKLCVRDELKVIDQSSTEPSDVIQFAPFGNYSLTFESLTLDSICNSKKCFNHNEAYVTTCPGFAKE